MNVRVRVAVMVGGVAAAVAVAAVSLGVAAREPASADATTAAASAGSAAVSLDAWAQGDVVDVLWAAPRAGASTAPAAHEHGAGGHAPTIDDSRYDLFHARSRDGGRSFGPPTQIGAGWAAVYGPHRGADPQIAAAGDRVVAVWTEPGTSQWGTGPLAVAVSTDGGRTWSRGGNPADDHSTDGHGFIDVAADPAGGFHAVWLDGRDGDSGLRVASTADGITWRANASVDAVTCQCCWNDLAVLGPGRLAVLYRDRDPRDMAVAVSEDGAKSWERRGVAGAFGWKVEGCPHVGGGLAVLRGRPASGAAAAPETLHALVWTGAPNRVGLYDVASSDGGRRWGEPRQLGGRGARHGDITVADGALAAAWDDGAAIYAARSMDGVAWGTPHRLTADGVRAQHPLLVATARGAVVLWTESTGDDNATSRWVATRF